MILTGYDIYRYYVATKTHFNSVTYDVFNYTGPNRAKCNIEAYEKRNDWGKFESLAPKFETHQSAIQYLVANLSVGFNEFLYDRETAIRNYTRWVAYKQSATYKFQVDLSEIEKKFNGSLNQTVWRCYLNKCIHIQTIHIINELNNIFNDFGSSILTLHHSDILRIKKCKGFVVISDKIINIFNMRKLEIP